MRIGIKTIIIKPEMCTSLLDRGSTLLCYNFKTCKSKQADDSSLCTSSPCTAYIPNYIGYSF